MGGRLRRRVDILVNNAGASSKQHASEINDSEWDRIQALNVTAAMTLTRELSPQMVSRGWGRVINISSILGHMSKESRSAYSTSKSALLGLTRAGAIDLGPAGVTVNALCPGYFLTDLPRALMPRRSYSARKGEGVAVPAIRSDNVASKILDPGGHDQSRQGEPNDAEDDRA